MISLTPGDLLLTALMLVVVVVLPLWAHQQTLARQVLVLASRSALQLLAVALVLQTLFDHATLAWIALLAMFMVLLAGREIRQRQQYRVAGFSGYLTATGAMFLSSMATALFALLVVIEQEPWYHPQYAIPLLGMLLGNTMNGIALGMDRLTRSAREQRRKIEAMLALGFSADEAITRFRDEAIRNGMIPILNTMAAAGVISLPGMMTGQILAGAAPLEAVKYQILILLLITAGSGVGIMVAVSIQSRQLFDERERLTVP